MKLKIIRGTVAGGVAVEPDDIVDVHESEGKFLITVGKACEYVPEPVKADKSVKVSAKKAKKATK